jgi:sugar lactone lactonase YvrE
MSTDRSCLCLYWAALAGLAVAGAPAVAAPLPYGRIFWSDTTAQTISTANLDGSDVSTFKSGLGYPDALAIDTQAGKIYWSEQTPVSAIRRSNLDGTGVETLTTNTLYPYFDIALDPAAGKMYYTLYQQLYRADLDGANPELLIDAGYPNTHFGLALDPVAGKLYYTEDTYSSAQIKRMNLDGTGVETLVGTTRFAYDIALDLANGKMYWAERSGGKIYRANLDGSGKQLLLDTLYEPTELGLDLTEGKMYWTNYYRHTVERANLDGSGFETVVTGLPGPISLAVVPVPEPSALALLAGGAVIGVRRKRSR